MILITAIVFNILTLTIVLTSGNFFYNNYSVRYFMTLNRLILIKTAKNIVIFINNNAFTCSLTGGIELSSTEPSTTRRSDVSNKSSNDKGKSATYFYDNNNNNNNNPPDLLEFMVNINLDELVNIANLTIISTSLTAILTIIDRTINT